MAKKSDASSRRGGKRKVKKITAREAKMFKSARKEPLEYMISEKFDDPGFHEEFLRFLGIFEHQPMPGASLFSEISQEQSPKDVEARVFAIANEIEFFLGLNYCRYRMAKLMEGVNGQQIPTEKTREIINWFNLLRRMREFLFNVHQQLVKKMVSKVRGMKLPEIPVAVSNGNQALLSAIDKFDVTRGFKFSTYACRAILHRIGSYRAKEQRQLARYRPAGDDDVLDFIAAGSVDAIRDQRLESLLEHMREIIDTHAGLSAQQKMAVKLRFGFGCQERDLAAIAKKIGCTKEGVRYILSIAFSSIAEVLKRYYGLTVKVENKKGHKT